MKRYTYKNKRTRKIVQSDVPLKDKDLVLITTVYDTKMRGHEVRQK